METHVLFKPSSSYLWVWYNGCALALQARDMGSIPITHSNFIAMQRIIF